MKAHAFFAGSNELYDAVGSRVRLPSLIDVGIELEAIVPAIGADSKDDNKAGT